MKKNTLPNGFTILTHQDPKLKNAVVNVLYKVGSAHETKNNTGLAHFLEHMMFEGSRDYPYFDQVVQDMMGENNAFTTQDYTCYYTSFPSEHLGEILRIERDRLEHLTMHPDKIDLEKKIILEEFKETSLNPPLSDAWHYLQKLCFKNAYSWPVIGQKLSHIRELTPSIVNDFYHKHYTPDQVILAIISDLPEEESLSLASDIFSKVKSRKTDVQIPTDTSQLSKKVGTKTLKRKNISSPHFFLAFHIDDFGAKNYFLADMFSDLLTNGESSVLYKSLITQQQLCSEINSYTTDNKHCNLLIIEGKLNTKVTFEQVYGVIERELSLLREKEITRLKFETLQNKAITYWSFYHYSPTQLAQNMSFFYYALESIQPQLFIHDMYQTISKNDLKQFISESIAYSSCTKLEYIPY